MLTRSRLSDRPYICHCHNNTGETLKPTHLMRPGNIKRHLSSSSIFHFAFIVCGLMRVSSVSGQVDKTTTIRGRVTTPSGRPIVEAEVGVPGTDLASFSNDSGKFELRGIPSGERIIRVRKIGFKPVHLVAKLAAGQAQETVIVLEPGAYELPDVEVTARAAKPLEYAATTKYDDFFRRRANGFGHYLTREQIERRHAFRTANLLSGIPSVRLIFRHSGISGTDVIFSRCSRVGVWIDGFPQRVSDIRVRTGEMTPSVVGEYLDRVRPSEIAAIEVYTGPAELPAEFLSDTCAAIVIWTR
jgi:hypothetical protein